MFWKEIPQKNKELAYRLIEKEFFIVQPEVKKLHQLSEVSARIWQLIDGKRCWREISDILLKEYEVGEEELKRDLLDFSKELKKKKLII